MAEAFHAQQGARILVVDDQTQYSRAVQPVAHNARLYEVVNAVNAEQGEAEVRPNYRM